MNIIELRKELDEAEKYAYHRRNYSEISGQEITDIWEQIGRLNKNLKILTKLMIHKGQ